MNKNHCNIVCDLIPLVLDRVASDESREMVETHIASCPECKKQYDAMKADLPAETRAEFEKEQKAFIEAVRSLKMKRLKRRIIAIVLAVVISMTAAFGGMLLYDRLYNRYSVTVDNHQYPLSLAKLQDGRIVVTVDGTKLNYNNMPNVLEVTQNGQKVIYLYYSTTPVQNLSQNISSNRKWCMTILDSEPDEIRQGDPDQYTPLWRKGETIPAASEEMEAYWVMEARYSYWSSEKIPEHDNGMDPVSDAEIEEAFKAVPEWQ